MGIIIRQSIFNSFITYTGICLGFFLTIFLYPHILNPDQYGLTRVLLSSALISAQLAHLGFHNLIIRYFPFFKQADRESHGLLFWTFVVPFVGFLIFVIIYWILEDVISGYYIAQSPLFVDFYLWVIPITLAILYFEVLNNYLRSLRDSTTGSIANEVVQRVVVIALLLIFFIDWINFSLFITLFVFSYLLQPFLISYRIWQLREFKLKPNLQILRKPILWGMASYSLYSLFGGLATVLVWNVDILMLGSMSGLESTAIYAIAFYIGSVITVPQRSIEKIASPLISEFINQKSWNDVADVYRKTSLNQFIPGLLIFGLIWLNIDILFMLLPDEYSDGKWVVFIIGIGKLIEMVTGANGVILLNSKYFRVSFYANLFLMVITIAANYMLIPLYGIEGAALATTASLFAYNGFKYFYLYYKLTMQPFTYSTLIILILAVALISLLIFIPKTGYIWIDMPILSMSFIVLFLAPIIYLNLSDDLNNLMISLLQKLKNQF